MLQRGWSRSRTLSVSYAAGTTSPLEPRGSTTQVRTKQTKKLFKFIIFYVLICFWFSKIVPSLHEKRKFNVLYILVLIIFMY